MTFSVLFLRPLSTKFFSIKSVVHNEWVCLPFINLTTYFCGSKSVDIDIFTNFVTYTQFKTIYNTVLP